MNLTFLRVSSATVLLLAVGTALAPHVTSHISSSAVVNAPLVTVYAPFDGVIERPSATAARAIEEGDTIVELKDARSQSLSLRSLQSDLAALSGEISGLEMQRNRLAGLKDELIARRDAQIAARLAWFKPRLREAQADIDSAEAGIARAEDDVDRIAKLAEKGSAPKRDLTEAKADLAEARALHDRQVATLHRLQTERDFLDGEEGIDLSSNEMERIEYRLDEIMVRDADLDARLLTLQTRRAGLKGEISGLELEKRRNDLFAPKSATNGVIWEASGQAKTTVATGEQVAQILDCRRRFLEVVLAERNFEGITPGDEVSVRLKGATKSFKAKVAAVYGSGARPNRNMQAAQPRIKTPDGLRVIVLIGPADPTKTSVARSFCDVGRSAEVHFAIKSGNPVAYLADKLRSWGGYATDTIASIGEDETATATN